MCQWASLILWGVALLIPVMLDTGICDAEKKLDFKECLEYL